MEGDAGLTVLYKNPELQGLYVPHKSMALTPDGNHTSGELVLSTTHPGYFEFTGIDPSRPRLRYLPPVGGYGPRVEVRVDWFRWDRANVWRIVEGRRSLVRGGVNRSTVGGLTIVDAEVPFGRPVTYQAGLEFEDGSGGFSPAETITLDESVMGADYGKVFLHNVLAPSRSIEYRPLAGAFGELKRSTPGDRYTPQGTGLPRWVGGTRSGLQNVDLSGYTGTLEDAATLERMLGDPYDPDDGTIPILCVRTPPLYRIPGALIVVVEESTARPLTQSQSGTGTLWPLVGNEVEPPFLGLVEPAVTWADIAARFPGPTGAREYAAIYSSLKEMARDYSLSGLSDD